MLSGTVLRDFPPPIFHRWTPPKTLVGTVFKDFSNFASNSRRYLRFVIDSPLLLLAESRYFPYCLKGESNENLLLLFFINRLIPVSIDMPEIDFEFVEY